MPQEPPKDHDTPGSTRKTHGLPRIPIVIAAGVVAILVLGAALAWHAEAKTNKIALVSSPKPVTVLPAKGEPFRAVHTYIGALRPWVEAMVGPQFISAY